MEINNESLISQANRIKQQRTSGNAGTQIRSQGEQGTNLKGLADSGGPVEFNSYLSSQVRGMDQSLREMQNQITSRQQLSYSFKSLYENIGQSSGRELYEQIGTNQNLVNMLEQQGQMKTLMAADNAEAKGILENIIVKLDTSINAMYEDVLVQASKSEVEIENFIASDLVKASDSNDVSNLINQYQANLSATLQSLNAGSVDNLVS